jgi:hypothetical protein
MKKTIAAAIWTVVLTANLCAAEPKELQAAQKHFQATAHPGEADRQSYITGLAALRAKFAEAKRTSDWQAVDAEIRRHPTPKDSDSNAFSKILVGQWASPRHEYVFRGDGTWSMLPAEPDATRGRWHIKGNQYFDTVGSDSRHYTILLLTAHDFIYTDGEVVFYETRIKK